MSYNYLNLPVMVGGATYTYLSDGTRVSVKLGDCSKKVTRGSFVYNVTTSGSASLESVSVPEGRIYCSDTPDGEPWMCWNLTDHLGNVRCVVFSRSWPSLDPLADRYLSTSPYAYCNSNPVNFVDPNGDAIYELSHDGKISLLEATNDKFDVLRTENADFYILDQSILPQLLNSGNDGKRKAVSSSGQSVKLFYFLSDNSDVEWVLHIDKKNGNPIYYLGSIGSENSAGSYETYMNSRPDISMHSHPNVIANEKEELFSMGIEITNKGLAQRLLRYDWDNVIKRKTAPIVYNIFLLADTDIC